jgi:transglutaminase-like putative cysteine protease
MSGQGTGLDEYEVWVPMQQQRSAVAATADPSSVDPFLRATEVIDWTTPEIRVLAERLAAGTCSVEEIARACFEWVRDEIEHCIDFRRDEVTCNASDVLRVGTGFCYAKSHLLVALLRANGLRAGCCYQRLAINDPAGPFVLHGLAAVDLGAKEDERWYRIDPRGNKPGVDAQFTPPVEHLAFPIAVPGERLFPRVYPDPVSLVVRTLQTHRSARALVGRLPDPATEVDLEA